MSRFVDLHTHSNRSDGTVSPAEVVRRARRQGIETLVLTDHDTVSGFEEARGEALRLGQRFACGVEINTREGDNVHILGYGVDPSSGRLRESLEEFCGRRLRRAEGIIGRLGELGVDLRLEEVVGLSREAIGRPHVADALRRKGVVRSRAEAFRRYLGRGAAAYVEPMGPTVEEAIALIREVGGFAVLAHPGLLGRDFPLGPWVDAGLEGIEAYYVTHTRPQVQRYLETAKRYGLMPTGGSDFHGPRTGHQDNLGVRLPEDVFSRIEPRLRVLGGSS
ncbi:MAG: PHP domain-containing protein [Elusimicrobiota bacterium]